MPLPNQPKGGRPKEEDLIALRERIETLSLNGLSAWAIARALAAPENTTPISLSVRTVNDHLSIIRKGWLKRAAGGELDGERARLVALAVERERTAIRAANRNADTQVGVGYMNVALKAQERLAKLLGLDVMRTELTGRGGGPVVIAPEPTWDQDLPPLEQARRLRLEADALEQAVAQQEAE